MSKKCESCRHYDVEYVDIRPIVIIGGKFIEQPPRPGTVLSCTNFNIAIIDNLGGKVPLSQAREICNREGDGIFVYFEPTVPTAGAAAEIPHSAIRTPQSLIQITRNRPRSRHAAAGGVL